MHIQGAHHSALRNLHAAVQRLHTKHPVNSAATVSAWDTIPAIFTPRAKQCSCTVYAHAFGAKAHRQQMLAITPHLAVQEIAQQSYNNIECSSAAAYLQNLGRYPAAFPAQH